MLAVWSVRQNAWRSSGVKRLEPMSSSKSADWFEIEIQTSRSTLHTRNQCNPVEKLKRLATKRQNAENSRIAAFSRQFGGTAGLESANSMRAFPPRVLSDVVRLVLCRDIGPKNAFWPASLIKANDNFVKFSTDQSTRQNPDGARSK